MLRTLPILFAVPLIVAFGAGDGLWNNRWGKPEKLEAAVARVATVPTTVGAWESRDQAVDANDVAAGNIDGIVSRQYTNRKTGASVSLLLVCGRPGPVSVHTPDICYQGEGYTMAAAPTKQAVSADASAAPAEFLTARFIKDEVAQPEALRIFWAWNATGAWEVPDNPRLAFGPAGVLYKLYLVSRHKVREGPVEEDPCLDFAKQMLPALQPCLFPAPPS